MRCCILISILWGGLAGCSPVDTELNSPKVVRTVDIQQTAAVMSNGYLVSFFSDYGSRFSPFLLIVNDAQDESEVISVPSEIISGDSPYSVCVDVSRKHFWVSWENENQVFLWDAGINEAKISFRSEVEKEGSYYKLLSSYPGRD